MNSSIEADSTPLSTTRKPLCFALLSARKVNAAPHLVTVALMHAAIGATHCALGAVHPIVADPAAPAAHYASSPMPSTSPL